jgi:hypothetical protein
MDKGNVTIAVFAIDLLEVMEMLHWVATADQRSQG